jgi:hypothetical protein
LTTKRYGRLVLSSLPPASVSNRFGDVYRFFSEPFDADYAIAVWANPDGEAAQYRWQLTRLPDGRVKGGTGLARSVQEARWTGVLDGVRQLQDAIQRGNRQIGDFGLEVRLPGIGGRGTQLLQDAGAELQERLQAFGKVAVITLEDASS